MRNYLTNTIAATFTIFLAFSVNAEELKTQIKGQDITATQMTKELAFELAESSPKKSKFESYDDLVNRYKEQIPQNWFYLDFDFDDVEYNVSKKRFEWEYGPFAQLSWKTPLGKFEGQNAYGAKADVDSELSELVNLSLERNITKEISDTDRRLAEYMSVEDLAGSEYTSVANYLFTRGYASREPVVFEIAPNLAEKIKSVRIFFKINTFNLLEDLIEATLEHPIQTVARAASLGISKDSILRVDGQDYSFYEADIEWKYSTDRGFKIVRVE